MKTAATALALTTIVLSMTAAFAAADLARVDAKGEIGLSADDIARARAFLPVAGRGTVPQQTGTRSFHLAPLQVADIDTDGDGLVSFDELFRADASLLVPLRGN